MARQTIGEFLQTLRRANGYTQQEVADKLGISNRTLSAWETDRAYPDILTLPELAALYGVTVDEILKGERSEHTATTLPTDISSRQERIMLKRNLAKYIPYSYLLLGAFCGASVLLCLSFVFTWINPIGEIVLFAIGAIVLILSLLLNIPLKLNANLYCDDEETEEQKRYSYRLQKINTHIVFIETIISVTIAALFWIIVMFLAILESVAMAVIFTILAISMAIYLYVSGKKTILHFGTQTQISQDKSNRKRFKKCLIASIGASVVCFVLGIGLAVISINSFQVLLSGTREEVVAKLHTINIMEESYVHQQFSFPIGTYSLDLTPFYGANTEISVETDDGFLCVGTSDSIDILIRSKNGDWVTLCVAQSVLDENGDVAAYNLYMSLPPEYAVVDDTMNREKNKFFDSFGYEPTLRTVDGETQFGIPREYRLSEISIKLIVIFGSVISFTVGTAVYFAGRKQIVIYK